MAGPETQLGIALLKEIPGLRISTHYHDLFSYRSVSLYGGNFLRQALSSGPGIRTKYRRSTVLPSQEKFLLHPLVGFLEYVGGQFLRREGCR